MNDSAAPAGRPAPRATYRLQLTRDFGFADVEALASYLGQIGISHAYLSPVFKARRGSTHGYDIVDHTRFNPELGTLDDFRRMAETLRSHNVGIILDIVPNHMGIGGDQNLMWLDVLEHGAASRYAHWFDINWTPPEPTLRDKVLVPFLGRSFHDALEDGGIELRFDPAAGAFAIWAEGSHKLPLAPRTYPRLLDDPVVLGNASREASPDHKESLRGRCAGDPGYAALVASRVALLNSPEGRDELVAIIGEQNWRVARHSVAADDINYRRFFAISDLAGLRVEDDEVFEYVHRLPFQLVNEGLVEGLRIDHIDGLYDPRAYCLRLRERCPRPIYLVVEKILAPHEELRGDWGVDGTTGYEFAGAVMRLLTDRRGEEDLTRAYQRFTGVTAPFHEIVKAAKLEIVDFEMTAELDALASRLHAIALADRRTADITRNSLRRALRQTVSSMAVYRTYVDANPLTDQDRREISTAIFRRSPTTDPAAYDFLRTAMAGEPGDGCAGAAMLEVARRIQQYTGPVMAKGLEDTALYRYNRLIALSDVGELPEEFGASIAAFHKLNAARRKNFPLGMLTSSSHDTKRGEDTRARIAAISGRAAEWASAIDGWMAQLEAQGAPEIDPNDAWYFFQLLLGTWPNDFPKIGEIDAADLDAYRTRIDAAMLKSVREARVRTNWAVPNEDYETRLHRFLAVALAADPENDFLAAFRELETRYARAGAHNGLVALTLKLTVPGVPDIYQGTEFWEQSMVDPDNRRPVNFAPRKAQIEERRPVAELIQVKRSEWVKQRLLADLLDLRKRTPKLFSEGTYEPLSVAAAEPVCGFVREWRGLAMVVLARLDPWQHTTGLQNAVALPPHLADHKWRNVFERDGDTVTLDEANRRSRLPVTVLTTAS